MIDRKHKLPVSHQCPLLGLARSSCYDEPRGESDANRAWMRRIDELYTRRPHGAASARALEGGSRAAKAATY